MPLSSSLSRRHATRDTSDISIATAAVAAWSVRASSFYPHRLEEHLALSPIRIMAKQRGVFLSTRGSPQKLFPMDGLNLASRQRDASFWQQQSCPLYVFLPRWLKLSKLSPSLKRADVGGREPGRTKFVAAEKNRLKWEGRGSGDALLTRSRRHRLRRDHCDTIGFLLNKVEWPCGASSRKEGWMVG